jgi:pantetheine-phosphate adenylyltransferase
MFSLDERLAMIEDAVEPMRGMGIVEVCAFPGLAVDAARDLGTDFIIKGLRTGGDFEVEQQMAQTNHVVAGVRTVYLPCKPALSYISSRFVREIAKYGGDVSAMVPADVAAHLERVSRR